MNRLNDRESEVWHDIRDDYKNYLKVGVKDSEVSSRIIKNNSDLFNSEYSDICWLSLADVEWDYGRLDNFVKEKAMSIIQNDNCNDISHTVKEKLDKQQPNLKKVSKIKIATPLWNIGDIIECKIDNPDSKWDGKIVYLHVVATDDTNIGTLPRDEFVNSYSIFKVYNLISDGHKSQETIVKSGYLQGRDIFTKEMTDLRYIACYNSERERKRILSSFNVIGNYKSDTCSADETLCGASFLSFDHNDMSFLCSDIDRACGYGVLNIDL